MAQKYGKLVSSNLYFSHVVLEIVVLLKHVAKVIIILREEKKHAKKIACPGNAYLFHAVLLSS